MRRYGQFCPVAKGAEVFAERWTPLVLRELLCGSTHFNDLHRGVPLMSRTLLSQRLKQLEEIGIVERKNGPKGPEHHLTQAGKDFAPIVARLGEWGQRWYRSKIQPRRTRRDPAGVGHAPHRQAGRVSARPHLGPIRFFRSAGLEANLVARLRARGSRHLPNRSGVRGEPVCRDRLADDDAGVDGRYFSADGDRLGRDRTRGLARVPPAL
jgi:DNA-binding HxlR family transcriptional regulator